ncbi:MAG TPA: sigma-70 family RNA polymerase sigma factor [Acidimicrobiales bacterium]|nr:sigma-70 family RNA polymerase sigma factor [Acidimicrobiales bacterium]
MDFDTYYSTSFDRVRRAMALTFRDPTLAEEITQEAFFQTLRKWPKVSRLDHPEGWTMIVALNKGRDLHRRRVRREGKQPLLVVHHSSNESGEALVDDRMMIATLLDGVSERQREALLLRYITQLTIPEIAVAMGCAEGTVKATLHAAIAKVSHQVKGVTNVTD